MLFALGFTPIFGQPPSPSPSSSPVFKLKMGNLRLWNMQTIGSPDIELVVGNDPQGHALVSAAPINFYAGYRQLQPGTYPLSVYRMDNRQVPIKTFTAVLRQDSFFTILVAQAPGGATVAELIDDTPDPTKPPNNQLTVRQFCPNVRVQVTIASGQKTDALEAAHTQTLTGLPNGIVTLNLRTTLANGSIQAGVAEADFRNSRRATLLMFTDPYGRVRPRVSIDGPAPADEDAVAKAQDPSTSSR